MIGSSTRVVVFYVFSLMRNPLQTYWVEWFGLSTLSDHKIGDSSDEKECFKGECLQTRNTLH